jgi:hypothetical protein
MAKIICTLCGKTGDSKCPRCRSIFGDEDTPASMIDTIMSYRLGIDKNGILLKRLRVYVDPTASIGPGNEMRDETDAEILQNVVGLLKRLSDAELKIVACTHRWDFAPFSKSEIGCGHGCEEKPLLDYMSDAWYHLNDREGATEGDLKAAEIINRALNAIDEGIEINFKEKE